MLTKVQKKIIQFLQGNLPLESAPYLKLAKALKVDEDRIIKEIKILKKAGYIRRLTAVLDHHKVGLRANCMCVWAVPAGIIKQIAKIAKSQSQISHCYLRQRKKNWPYNFYTMIHGRSKTECLKVIKHIEAKTGINNYQMLFTQKQLKKVSPQYKI